MSVQPFIDRCYDWLLSDHSRRRFEKFILVIAIVGFAIHLLLILLARYHLVPLGTEANLLTNPIAATYTPFSFILVYEVYLLVYYLPRSITAYIGKQYEIVTLIVFRRLFKDLASVEITANWFAVHEDLRLTGDLVASLLLSYLLLLFIKAGRKRYGPPTPEGPLPPALLKFISFKKLLAAILIPILFFVASYTLFRWSVGVFVPTSSLGIAFTDLNSVFFDQFFTILILVDVVLLLLSLFFTSEFHKVIRNSGFIVSTILIRLSFSVEGIISTVLLIASVIFGLVILLIHNLYEKDMAEHAGSPGNQPAL